MTRYVFKLDTGARHEERSNPSVVGRGERSHPSVGHEENRSRYNCPLDTIPPISERGLCVGQWDLWDEDADPGVAEQAVSLCLECPVLGRCREWAATLTNRELSGVVAGIVRPWSPTRSKAAAS